jgi:hypothetical protein
VAIFEVLTLHSLTGLRRIAKNLNQCSGRDPYTCPTLYGLEAVRSVTPSDTRQEAKIISVSLFADLENFLITALIYVRSFPLYPLTQARVRCDD